MAATIRPDQVRASIAAQLEGLTLTTGTLGTLREATCGYDEMPAGVSDQRQHLAFGLTLPSTTEAPEQRQRQGRPLRVATAVSLRLLHKQRPTDSVADFDAAVAAESEAIVAVVGTSGADGLQVTYNATTSRKSIPQTDDTPGAVLIELHFIATHNVATS